MARDNRKDNRAKGKEAGNENKAPDGTDFSDLLDTNDDNIDEEDVGDIEKGGENDENEDDGENNADEDAAKREADAAKAKADANDVKKETKGEEDGAKAKPDELNADGTPKEKVAEKSEETEDEKKARLAEEAKAKEPTPEEKEAARLAEVKRLQDEEDAAKAKKVAEEAPKTLTDEEAAELFKDWRSTTETLLAESHYKLTEEDVAQLNENPAAYIPRAMSRVYLDTISASFQQFVNYLPRMVHQVLEARDANMKQENSFFEKWEELNTEVGKAAVRRLGAAYRQANPSASTEDWINEVGAQAMVALRITPKTVENAKVIAEAEKKPSFKPATGTETSAAKKEEKGNPFADMAKEFGVELDAEEIDGS